MSDDALSRLVLEFEDAAALAAEFESNLSHGGAFVPDRTDLAPGTRCVLELACPARGALELEVEVVWVKTDGAGPGCGVSLGELDAKLAARLERFAADRDDDTCARFARNVHERVRQLSMTERLTLARRGEYAERVALERAFGKAVWEALLANPKLTPPEVARIARMGTLPAPLVDVIASNRGWLATGEVRRALLSNPKLRGASIDKVLRALPRVELKAVPRQTAYPANVKSAARRLLGNG